MTDGRSPGEGRYAHLEREQRWLVGVPPALDGPGICIEDRYLAGSRLRLRRATNGSAVVHKLGQKVRVDAHSPERVKLTNIYLSDAEFELLLPLDGHDLRKRRWRTEVAGRVVVVDVFEGDYEGLVLAEVELGPDDSLLAPPPFAVADVTHDDRFSGGALAALAPDDRRALVSACRT